MGVYTFDGGTIKPFPTEPGGTAAGNGNIIVPSGKWTDMALRVTGHYIGTQPDSPANLVGGIYLNSGAHSSAYPNTVLSGGTFDTGFIEQGFASLYNLAQNVGKNSQYTLVCPGTFSTTTTIDSIQLQLIGTLNVPSNSGIAMPIKMGNLFFFNPTYPEPSLGGPNTPPTYPDPQFNFPQYEDTFSPYPSGGLRSRAREGNDQQGSRGKMSCLVPKQTVYLTIPGNLVLPQNFPIMVILNYPNTTAQWLKWNPGLYNQNGTPGQIEARIYQGNPGSAQPGIWVPSVGLTNLRPVWVGQGSFSDLIPWGGQPMQLVIELAGISNIPAGSFFDAVLEGFDSD